jgi:hypothetical protein
MLSLPKSSVCLISLDPHKEFSMSTIRAISG